MDRLGRAKAAGALVIILGVTPCAADHINWALPEQRAVSVQERMSAERLDVRTSSSIATLEATATAKPVDPNGPGNAGGGTGGGLGNSPSSHFRPLEATPTTRPIDPNGPGNAGGGTGGGLGSQPASVSQRMDLIQR